MIIETKENLVDFEVPITMTEEQKKRFITFCKETFDDVEVVEIAEKSKEIGDRKSTNKSWKPEDIALLFSGKSEEELSEKLERSTMSIRMARGSILPEVTAWAKKKGKSLPLSEEDIKSFLEDGK